MKRSELFRKVIFSSWFLALIPTVFIVSFITPLSSKYSFQIEPVSKPVPAFYRDLNSDNVSEGIYTGWGAPFFFITIRDQNLRTYDQWNLTDSVDLLLSDLNFGNFDHDQFEEIYAFTYEQDSLFLDVIEPLDSAGKRIEREYITRIGYLNGSLTSKLNVSGFYDVNGDGYDEIYFGIVTGFGLQPRKLYYFDLVNLKLKESQFLGSNCFNPKMYDADGDGDPEIFGTIPASGNYKTDVPFSDNSAWLLIFDHNLEFEFPPVEFPGFGNSVDVKAYKFNKQKGYAVGMIVSGLEPTGLFSRINLYSQDGKLIRTRPISEIGADVTTNILISEKQHADKIFLFMDKVFELNENLGVVSEIELPFQSKKLPYQIDINSDREREFLFYNEEEGMLFLYNPDMKKIGEQSFNPPDAVWRFSYFSSPDFHNKLFLNSGDKGYFISYVVNKYYLLAYLIHPGIYIFILLFILIIKRINTFQITQKEKYKNRLLTLQLQAIKSQLDPHFTFNALNSIASLIYHEDRQLAYDYMNKFTRLLRTMLSDAEKVYRSIEEELEFVKTYLEMEKLRFGDKFDYQVDIREGVSLKVQVPKLVLQIFVENAIKHGLLPCTSGGMLLIRIEKESDYLKLSVEDNGIGMVKSAGNNTSTGKGLKLTAEFYDILNQLNKKPIKYHITDLYNDEGGAAGTRVEVWVPEEGIL